MDQELPLSFHFEELRKRFLISLIWTLGIFVVLLPYSSSLFKILKYPSSGLIDKFVFFSPEHGFSAYLKISAYASVFASLPVWLYHLWKFIEPALEEETKNTILYVYISFVVLFFLGVAFSYFVLIPFSLKFLLSFGKEDFYPMISVYNYVSFIMSFSLITGFVFEAPLVSYALTRFGLINHRLLRKKYKHAVIAILIISAIITPTGDFFNMFVFSLPLLILYELSIWISKITQTNNLVRQEKLYKEIL